MTIETTPEPCATPADAPRLRRIQGRWWTRRGCVAAAFDGFQAELPAPRARWWTAAFARLAMKSRLFALREGSAWLAAHGWILLELPVAPEAPLAVFLDRLIAFEDTLEFRTRFIRRVPLSGAGARHAAILSGTGRIIVAAMSPPIEFPIEAHAAPDAAEAPDFDPDALAAWSATLVFNFSLRRLGWSAILSPRGFRETRLTASGAGVLWLDAGAGPELRAGPSPRENRRPDPSQRGKIR